MRWTGWRVGVGAVPLVVAGVLLLSDCGIGGSGSGGGTGYAGLMVTQPRTLGVGESVVLTASSGTGARFTPGWGIYGPATNLVGTLTGQTGNSITYTAPAVPPLYPIVYGAISSVVPQGQVQVQVSDTAGVLTGTDAQIVITAASVAVGISPATISVFRGGRFTLPGMRWGR